MHDTNYPEAPQDDSILLRLKQQRGGLKSWSKRDKIILTTLTLFLLGAVLYQISGIGNQSNRTGFANTYQAHISLQPETLNLHAGQTLKVYVNPQNTPMVFAAVQVLFDPSKVTLTQAPEMTPLMRRVIKVTPITEANTTGVLNLVLGVDPGNAPQTEVFEFASLSLQPVDPSPFSSQLTITSSSPTSVVSDDAREFTLTTANATVSIPAPSPTPELSPRLEPTPITSSAPISSSGPSVGDVTKPVVVITNPLSGTSINRNSTLMLSADATDIVGVQRVVFLVTEKSIVHSCTDATAPYSCNWNVPAKPNADYTVRATVYNVAGDSSYSEVSVTSRK